MPARAYKMLLRSPGARKHREHRSRRGRRYRHDHPLILNWKVQQAEEEEKKFRGKLDEMVQ